MALCVLFTLALRVPFLTKPLMPDEAGMLIIAQNWHEGPFLYGDYFVGRGILLVLIYSAADALGGALVVRLFACVAAAMMVVAAGWAGHQLRGRRGAGWAALVAAAYSSTYAFSSEVMNERLLAAVLVMGSCAVTLSALRRRSPMARATLAGVLATTPLLVVQSYVDGFVFAVVLLLASWHARTLSTAHALRIAAGGLLGMLLTAAAVALGLWATWLTPSQLWFQSVGYRVAASHVVGLATEKPAHRMMVLLILAALTGVLLLAGSLLTAIRELRRRTDLRPVWFAIVAMFGLTLASMAAGGDYWHDYLLQPIPALAMAAALVAPSPTWSGLAMRVGAAVAAVAAVVATWMALMWPVLGSPSNEAAVGRWLAAGAEPEDTAVVLWGKANVLHHADMTSPYPYLWSLLTRTLDPDLEDLLATLHGPEAPTWVVEWHDFDSWGLDSDGRLADVVHARYIYVGTPCGVDVFLLRDEQRDVPPPEVCGQQLD